jgi:uncharacterized protein YcaQ
VGRSVTLSKDEARQRLVAHLGLNRSAGRGARGTRAVLTRLRSIQLDPLDAIGTNADLVVMARVDDARRGDVWRHLFPRHAFEHFAKERCILPADAFPWYRDHGHKAQAPWWRHSERESRIAPGVVAAVLEEIRARGPVTAADLADHGAVDPIDWSGWTGTARAATMALEILWTRCDIVVSGRTQSGAKLYDLPARSLGMSVASAETDGDFDRWALLERVRAAGLLARAGGSTWSMLGPVRNSGLPDRMLDAGELIEVRIEGSSRPYLALPDFPGATRPRFDGRVRILGPLDALLWDRPLVRTLFDFDYVWEVYKPAAQRRWGWYVCPILQRDRLIGRIDARAANGLFPIRRLWLRPDADPEAVREAVADHAERCGCPRVTGFRTRREP